jgi:hypothetical protein
VVVVGAAIVEMMRAVIILILWWGSDGALALSRLRLARAPAPRVLPTLGPPRRMAVEGPNADTAHGGEVPHVIGPRPKRMTLRSGTMLPDATQVADPFHVVRLANSKLDECRRRVQNDTLGHRGR